MSQELVYAIINLAVVVTIVAVFFLVISPRITKHINIPPRFDGKVPSGDIGTFNGIGLNFLGDYRYDWKTRSFVTYEFFTLLIPIFPTNCYRVRLLQDYSENHKTIVRKYHIYGTEKWHWFEVTSVYIAGFSGIALLVVIINLFQAIF